ncbi:MAG: hypothetical protein ACYCVY_02785 [Acidiferrobacteraceae bacterium]
MSDICVVHLVRAANGLAPFSSFLDSYKNNPGGLDHQLLIIFKGFRRAADTVPYRTLLADYPFQSFMISDYGFDIRPYFISAERFDHTYFCFLNSFSVLLDTHWLLKLYKHITRPEVGLVGASGSYGSIRPTRVADPSKPFYVRITRAVAKSLAGWYLAIYFDTFPNYHIRTNGFMIARNTMLKLHRRHALTKLHAYRLESGKCSITKQVGRMGLRTLVVGRDGLGYDKEDWIRSNTFWQGTQSNLLVSDNQTRKYDNADAYWKKRWELFAWGQAGYESTEHKTTG